MLQTVNRNHHGRQILLPIQHANLLPSKRDEAKILSASQHMNHHLQAGRSVPAFRFRATNNILVYLSNMTEILWGCVGTSVK